MITERDLVGCRCFTIENGDLSLTVSEYGATAMSLTRDGAELLLGFEAQAFELVLPPVEVALLPVSVGALYNYAAAGGDFRHDGIQFLELGVVCIYKYCNLWIFDAF